jgi:hypothetical protein
MIEYSNIKVTYTLVILLMIMMYLSGCNSRSEQSDSPPRFFSDGSFWNQPIPENPEIDPRSIHYINLIKDKGEGNFAVINIRGWTIPVYEVDNNTPRIRIRQREYSDEELRSEGWDKFIHPDENLSQGKEFGPEIPVPSHAVPDPERDGHMALIDRDRNLAWDMWDARKLEDGTWESSTGMVYPLDGDGIFQTEDFDVKTGESIHFFGPGRASGVPAIAGLILYEEIRSGTINHKLAACTPANAFREFVYPACWTDGTTPDGIPEGAVIQLDPQLDLDQFDLLPGEIAVCRALQEYGVVVVDNGGAFAIYAEGLYGHDGRSWNGLLTGSGISQIPKEHFRVLKLENVIYDGH